MSQELLWDVTHGGPLCVSDANWHYVWGLKDALAVVTGIKRVACTTPSALLCCWRHETLRVFGDRLTCTADVAALTASVDEILRRNTAVIAGASVLVGVDALEDYLLSVCCMSLSDFFRTLDPANEGQVSRDVLASALGRLPAAAGNEAEGSGGGGNAFAGVEGVRNTGRLLGSLPDVFGLADLKALRQHPAWADPTASSPGDTEAPLGRRDMPPFYVDFIDPAADDHLAATTRAGAQGTGGHCKGECKPCWRLSDLHEQVLLHAQALTPIVWAGAARPQCVVTHEFLRHLVRALRVLNIPGAHAILVAEPGAGAREVASLAAHIAHCELHDVAAGSEQAFNGDLRALFRVAGCQNVRVAAITDGHALSHGVLERLNGLLVTGQVFDLFGRDERAALLEGLADSLASDGRPGLSAAALFTERVRHNLHFVLLFNDFGVGLRTAAEHFPSLITACYVDRYSEASPAVLTDWAATYLRHHSVLPAELPLSVHVNVAQSLIAVRACACLRSPAATG